MEKKNNGIAVKKVSICSLDNFGFATLKSKESKLKDVAPRDRFCFVQILFLLLGLMHFIPYSFFVTANAYWMYKFRDVNANLTDTDARTVLQTHFSPASSILNTIFTPVTVLVSTFFGFKIKVRTRVLATLVTMSFSFIAGTAFVKTDTDSWQLTFFVITMVILTMISSKYYLSICCDKEELYGMRSIIILLIIICFGNAAFGAGNLAILARFPPHYMKMYLTGEGMAGISSATLQIVSLAMGTSTEVSALFYFVSGSTLMTSTMIMFYASKYNRLYNYHVNSIQEDVSKDVLQLSAAKALAKEIWAQVFTLVLLALTLTPVMPSITSLVVSENYGSGSVWTDTYFVPVITFLYSDGMGLTGRLMSAKINKTFNGVPLSVFMIVRMIVMIPLVFFCNAQPRNYLSVLFPHDYQYILILGVFTFTNGYFINTVYLDVAKLVGPEKAEDAYLVMLSITSLATVLFMPIGMFSVDLL